MVSVRWSAVNSYGRNSQNGKTAKRKLWQVVCKLKGKSAD